MTTRTIPTCPHCKKPLHDRRSTQDHRRFFAVLQAAFHHWPEAHDFQPESVEHLRAWLLCKAGHCFVRTFELPDGHDAVTIARLVEFAEQLMQRAGPDDAYRFGRWKGMTLKVFSPKSIAFTEVGQREFGDLREKVEDIIAAEIGVPVDQLLAEHEGAA